MTRIVLTPEAREEIRRAHASGAPSVVTVSFAGGCGAAGFIVRLTRRGVPDAEPLDMEGILVSLDGLAVQRLDGAVIDFSEPDGWRIEHPEAVEPTVC